jgi:hypothetical protein
MVRETRKQSEENIGEMQGWMYVQSMGTKLENANRYTTYQWDGMKTM